MNKAYLKYERRTAIYKMSAEAAREMYKTRSPHDKNTPFKVYIMQCIADSGLKYPISELELV